MKQSRFDLFGPRWLRHVHSSILESQPVTWSPLTIAALAALVCFWGAIFVATWARWGDVTIDTGRDMYVPWQLAQGKTLYRDIWYGYGPLAPYLNKVLFQLWGMKLEVLYWAGSLSALLSAILLYLIGMRLSFWPAGWTAGALLLAEAFSSNLFCFPLPYSFAAVYGCVAACLCLWCCVSGVGSSNRLWVFGAASAAAAALLLKTEFGAGCYVAVGLLITARALQASSLSRFMGDLFALVPGLVVCAAIIAWMISLGGAEFLLQENLAGLPGTWFAKRYGAFWLVITTGSLTGRSLVNSGAALLVYVPLRLIFRRFGVGWRVFLAGLAAVFILSCIIYYNGTTRLFAQRLFFPKAMIFLNLISVPLFLLVAWRSKFAPTPSGWFILLGGSGILAARTVFKTQLGGYSIYCNGPVILAFLLLVTLVALPRMPRTAWRHRPAEILPFVIFFVVAFVPAIRTVRSSRHSMEPLRTERGLIYVPLGKAAPYQAAIQFMKTAAQRNESTISVPEDASLYFLASVDCPSRVFLFTPGLIAPGKMTSEVIREIGARKVRWLIWSNRSFPEYQTPEFGVDFDQPLGDYFRSHFRPVASLPGRNWSATIWERADVPDRGPSLK